MALVKGMIGFVTEIEKEPGYYEDSVIERSYSGSILKNNQRFNNANSIQGEIRFTNTYSLIGDSYLFKHITEMRYFVWKGQKWIMENVNYDFPRIEFNIGGIYHGPQETASEHIGAY